MNIKINEFSYSTNERILYEKAVVDVDFTNIILKGRNGCGKSTLLSLLYNEKLEWILDGNKLKKTEITYITQESKIFNELKVSEHIALFKVHDKLLLETIEGLDIFDKKVKKLSGGEKQVLNICLGLNKKSKILFIDEPFNNVSQRNREIINNLLLADTRPKLIVSHKEIDFCDVSLTVTKRRIHAEVLSSNKDL